MPPPTAKEQLKIIKNSILNNPITSGSTGFLLSYRWFKKWKQFTGFEHEKIDHNIKITKIDNSHLLLGNEISPTISDHYDYILVSRPTYEHFREWYGGGPEIEVPIVTDPHSNSPVPVIVEWHLTVWHNGSSFIISTNKYETVATIKAKSCEHFGADPSSSRLVDYWNKNITNVLRDAKYLYEEHIINTQELLLESKNENGEWPRRRTRNIVSRTNSSMNSGIISCPSYHITNGLVGLTNLGNTCYFNAAVQCVVHTELLTNYFDSGIWRRELNVENRLGTGGTLANCFAQLENDVWTKAVKVLTPKNLRDTVAKFYPRFGGNQQHDSQELLLCFLDALSEDLNRVHEKKYLEGIDGDGTNDSDVADAAWKRHKLSQDSAIVDIFHGQLKTEIECGVCHTKRVVFDPYMCISVPIQVENQYQVRYCFIHFDLSEARFVVKILVKEDNELVNILSDSSARFSVDIDSLIVFARDELTRDFKLSLPNQVRKSEYFVFELPTKCEPSQFYMLTHQSSENESNEEEQKEEEKEQKIEYVLCSLIVQNTKDAKQTFAIDTPIIAKCPSDENDIGEIAEERISYLWTHTKFPATDRNRMLSQKAANFPSDKWEGDERIHAIPTFKTSHQESDSFIPFLSSQSYKISINPKMLSGECGFECGAVCPLDHTYDGTNPCNEEKLTLEKCLLNLTSREDLNSLNKWFCPTCKEFVSGDVTLSVWSVPDVLVLHLKRFVEKDGIYKKVTTYVEYPTVLDMIPFITGPQKTELSEDAMKSQQKYALYATINHVGVLNGGHYTANIFCDKEEKWYTFNDESVYPTSDNMIVNENAYVLLYKRIQNIK